MDETEMKKRNIICVLIIVSLSFVVYANSLNNKFVWDDHFLITDNPLVKSWSGISRVMTEDVGYGPKGSFILYRPAQILSYILDYSVWRLDARGYHITNIAIHALAALALFWFINTLFGDRTLSLFTALVFAVHPVHTEAVTYIAGRADLLAGLFILASLTLYIKGMYAASVVIYIPALFSKEYSVILPFLILLYHGIFRVKVRSAARIWLFAFVTVSYLTLRFIISRPLAGSLSFLGSAAARVPGFFAAIANYIRILFVPADLHMEYGSGLFGFNDQAPLAGLLMTAALFFLWSMRRKNKIIRFAVPWFFLTLLPVSNIYPMNAYMAEHWLYLPSISFFLLLGSAINSAYKIRPHRPAAILCLGVIIAGYSYLTVTQNFRWADPIEFYRMTIGYAPASARLYGNLGTEYSGMGLGAEAMDSYKKAISTDPSYTIAYNNLGTEYKNVGDYARAKRLYEKAIALSPGYASPYYNLGILYNSSGEEEKAITCYKKAIELLPRYAEAYNNLGNIYRHRGDTIEAVRLYEKAIDADKNCHMAYSNISAVYIASGRKEKAVEALKNVVRLDPENVEARNNIGNIYSSLGKHREAVLAYSSAIRIKPDFAESYNNLGTELGLAGRTKEAIVMFGKALQIDPDNSTYNHNLRLAREAADRCGGK